jgi:hypothetical protein
MTMYEDGRKTGDYEEDIEILGVSELLAEAIEAADEGDAGVTAGVGPDADDAASEQSATAED